jgi:hypothetical protein
MQIAQLNKEKEGLLNQLQAKDKVILEAQAKSNEFKNANNG